MTKYFKQKSTGLILKADRKEQIEQYEKHSDHYTPVDINKMKPKATTAAPKGNSKPKTGQGSTPAANTAPSAPSATTGDADK